MILNKLSVFLLLVSLSHLCFGLSTSCPSDYFFDQQHCEKCQTNCVCTSELGCDKCISGATLYNGVCVTCPLSNGIYGKCSECCSRTTGTMLSCTDCASVANMYSFLFSGRCILSSGCFQVNANGFCQECRTGFYEFNNLCYTCDSSCSTCSDIDNCLTCADGYYMGLTNGGLCKACPDGCSKCSSNLCLNCLNKFYLYLDQCLPCPENCQTCVDGSTCTSCTVGIMVSSLCVKCDDTTYGGTSGCLTCSQNNNFIQCNACDDLYFLDSNSGGCLKCSDSIVGALRCIDINLPTQCQNDYSVTLTNRYYLVGITCVLNTKSCKKISSVDGNCSSCYDGYIITSGTCVQCSLTGCNPNNIYIVNNTCRCNLCLTGYYLSGFTCIQCATLQCSVCPSGVCSQCLPNYYFSTGSCLPSTVANCLVSLSNTQCTTCNSGYYKGNDLLCYQCQTNCLICSNTYTCTSCSMNTKLVGGFCVSYPSNCVAIADDNVTPLNCKLCEHGYYLSQGTCLPCKVELGTLSKCVGLCPIDQYINNLLSVTIFSTNLQLISIIMLIYFIIIY